MAKKQYCQKKPCCKTPQRRVHKPNPPYCLEAVIHDNIFLNQRATGKERLVMNFLCFARVFVRQEIT